MDIPQENNLSCKLIDGDIIRRESHKDLDFSRKDIIENNKRILLIFPKRN